MLLRLGFALKSPVGNAGQSVEGVFALPRGEKSADAGGRGATSLTAAGPESTVRPLRQSAFSSGGGATGSTTGGDRGTVDAEKLCEPLSGPCGIFDGLGEFAEPPLLDKMGIGSTADNSEAGAEAMSLSRGEGKGNRIDSSVWRYGSAGRAPSLPWYVEEAAGVTRFGLRWPLGETVGERFGLASAEKGCGGLGGGVTNPSETAAASFDGGAFASTAATGRSKMGMSPFSGVATGGVIARSSEANVGGPLRERCRWWKDGRAASVGLEVGGARMSGAALAMDEEDEDQMSLRRPGESGERSEASLGLLACSSAPCSHHEALAPGLTASVWEVSPRVRGSGPPCRSARSLRRAPEPLCRGHVRSRATRRRRS